jgi:hypothetical protein
MQTELGKRANVGFTLLWLLTEAIGYTGALLIGYVLLSWYTNNPWPLIEQYADRVSSLLTIIATGFTALSVYFPATATGEPWDHSKYFVAPIVLGAVVVALVLSVLHGDVPHVAVNGFALLGISGGLKRVIPRSIPSAPAGS